jgi:hypothetical protein
MSAGLLTITIVSRDMPEWVIILGGTSHRGVR